MSVWPERVTVYVDILGFSHLVEKMAESHEVFTTVLNRLRYLSSLKRSEDVSTGILTPQPTSTLEMTAFSDCYVISDERDRLYNIVAAVQLQIQELLRHGMLCRGAVVIGGLLHENRVVVGPALVQASRLEKTTAIYPGSC